MAMSTTPKIQLTKRGVLQNDKIVAPAIRLFARGQRRTDGGYIAQFWFREMNGADKSIYLEWEYTIPEKKRELKSTLATAGYWWPRDKKLSDAIWAALLDTNPERRFAFVNAPGWYGPGFALPGKYFCHDKTAVPVEIDPNSIEHVGLFTTGDGASAIGNNASQSVLANHRPCACRFRQLWRRHFCGGSTWTRLPSTGLAAHPKARPLR